MTHPSETHEAPARLDAHILTLRRQLEGLFREAMKRIDASDVVTQAIEATTEGLRIGQDVYAIQDCRNVVIITIGKAAVPMCNAAVSMIRPILLPQQALSGVVIGPRSDNPPPAEFQYFDGGHPLPNAASVEGAYAVIQVLTGLELSDLVLFLISGGASAMMEAPLDATITQEEVHSFYRALVHSGLPITEVNILRKHFSRVKGGRLALLAAPAMQSTLIISDVPGEAYDMVGSGPSLPDPSSVDDCRRILGDPVTRSAFSESVLRYFDDPSLCETPSASDLALGRSACTCLLSNQILLEELRQLATQAGFHSVIDTSCDDWDYQAASTYLMDRLRALRTRHARVCLISGGEVAVKVNEPSGTGGRNQHFALYSAMQLRDSDPPMAIMSVGTDGVDGNSLSAGAMVDSLTMKRIQACNLDAAAALETFDSHTLLSAVGDAVTTGPTGNNVRDVRILLSA